MPIHEVEEEMSEYRDLTDCCGAPFYADTDLCTQCKEHASSIDMSELDDMEKLIKNAEEVSDEMLFYLADNYPARYMRFVTKDMMIQYT